MSLARDLLDQADLLANKEPRRPKQASLRRAVSTAYYALFHLLIEDAANALSPRAPAALRKVVARAFQHGDIKLSCQAFVEANAAIANRNASRLRPSVSDMITFPLAPEMIKALSTFVELQEARHKADYDLSEQLNKVDVAAKLSLARDAFTAWASVRKSENAAVFMASLLVRKTWGK